MCTAATYQTKDFYFGRTLDYEFSFHEEVTIMPRDFPLPFRYQDTLNNHFAIIGMAYVVDNYPLYYDAVNEKGLAMAGLNFVGNAVYGEPREDAINIAQFELIPWILGQCENLTQAKEYLRRLNLTNTAFNEQLPTSQLHWIVSDKTGSITVESTQSGLHIYDNPLGVLTNNPTFPEQMFNLNNYMHLSTRQPVNSFSTELPLKHYSRGMGALGLPGDLSSQSRFVRAAFVKMNAKSDSSEESSVSQFFHILGSVDQQRGCCEVEPGKYEITIYTSCMNASKGIYYYTSYDNQQITAVDMHREDLNSQHLVRYPMILQTQIRQQN